MTCTRRCTAVVTVVLAGLSALAMPAADAQTTSRTIYATVTDGSGKPILDMRADEFEVREGGRIQEITARPATTPLRVALIVSDRGGGQFQLGALRFSEAVLGYGEVSLIGVVIQPETLTDFTSRPDALRDGLLRLGRRAAPSGGAPQLIETILEVAKVVRRDGWRPAIVVIRAGGEALTPISAVKVREAINASRAVFYAVSTARADASSLWPDGYGESRLALPSVLGDGTRESGGRHIDVVVNTMVPTMQQVASELVNQYEITYTLPAGAKPSDRISVTTTRRNVTIRAPTRLTN